MNKFTPTLPVLAAAAALLWTLPPSAQADDQYFGVSLATPGEARLQVGPKASVNSDNQPLALKLYAGMKLSTDWSAEIGYGAFGSWHFKDPSPGSKDQAKLASQAFTLAAKYSWAIGDSWSLFGKLGVAINRLQYSDSLGQKEQDSFTRPMWGLGAELKLSDKLSVPLEFEYLGSAQTKLGDFKQQKLELGLRYRF